MEDTVTGGQLFGLTRTHNHLGSENSYEAYVFRTKLDASTGAVLTASSGGTDFNIKRLD